MKEPQSDTEKRLRRNIRVAAVLIAVVVFTGLLFMDLPAIMGMADKDESKTVPTDSIDVAPAVVDGKDTESGLIAAEGMEVVRNNCTGCHSAKLITQNHLSRERWEKTIRWMQKNQNLGDLGLNEKIILDYLAANYGPVNSGRRKPLEKQSWYELK